jgi:hypothetical protein
MSNRYREKADLQGLTISFGRRVSSHSVYCSNKTPGDTNVRTRNAGVLLLKHYHVSHKHINEYTGSVVDFVHLRGHCNRLQNNVRAPDGQQWKLRHSRTLQTRFYNFNLKQETIL